MVRPAPGDAGAVGERPQPFERAELVGEGPWCITWTAVARAAATSSSVVPSATAAMIRYRSDGIGFTL